MQQQATPIIFSSVFNALEQLRTRGIVAACTADVIAAYKDEYVIDYGVAPARSWNAAFGRFLKKHRGQLRIAESQAKQPFTAADGGRTTCSIWAI
jgi:hypothetical protein